jgi:hypothetical protein
VDPPAAVCAGALLAALPTSAEPPAPRREHPALAWARSGAMALSGRADEPPRLAPAPLAVCAEAALDALRALAPESLVARGDLDGAALLGERAAHLGLARRGAISPGGSCRLLRATDGFVAVSLPREDDRVLVEAWLGERAELERGARGADDPWGFVASRVAERRAAEAVERARLLGLAVAPAADPAPVAPPWLRVRARGGPRPAARARSAPLVLDLSALWAGPLCGRLLALAGARVVKVECVRRPDGARLGPPAFHDALNAGKASVALDFRARGGLASLRALVERADAVIESARPRGLAQLGIDAEAWVRERPGRVWVSITGYGRGEPEGRWVAFGDDAAAAAGLAAATGDPGAPLFCGDAIADPLTGLHAAVAALAYLRAGEGALLELALRDVTAHCLALGDAREGARVEARGGGFEVVAEGGRAPVAPPRATFPGGAARPLGADTAGVLAELGIRC